MWTSLALAALAFAPAQPPAGALQLTNVRLTIGELGPTRPTNKLLPGDVLYVGYDIEGLPIDPDGTAKYTIAMEVIDSANKIIFKQDPREMSDFVPLRGNRMPARAFVTIGLDQEPGMYSCKVTVTEPKSKSTSNITVKFEVLKKDFGIVAVLTTYDLRMEFPAPTSGTVGQTIFIWMSIASFERDAKTKQPNVEIEFTVLDEKGQPTLEKPVKQVQNSGIEADKGAFRVIFPLYMNRPGTFTVRVTAVDKVANKTSTYELPVTVIPAK